MMGEAATVGTPRLVDSRPTHSGPQGKSDRADWTSQHCHCHVDAKTTLRHRALGSASALIKIMFLERNDALAA